VFDLETPDDLQRVLELRKRGANQLAGFRAAIDRHAAALGGLSPNMFADESQRIAGHLKADFDLARRELDQPWSRFKRWVRWVPGVLVVGTSTVVGALVAGRPARLPPLA
jgi:hypothetical protein